MTMGLLYRGLWETVTAGAGRWSLMKPSYAPLPTDTSWWDISSHELVAAGYSTLTATAGASAPYDTTTGERAYGVADPAWAAITPGDTVSTLVLWTSTYGLLLGAWPLGLYTITGPLSFELPPWNDVGGDPLPGYPATRLVSRQLGEPQWG
jgi:hypothetical protein